MNDYIIELGRKNLELIFEELRSSHVTQFRIRAEYPAKFFLLFSEIKSPNRFLQSGKIIQRKIKHLKQISHILIQNGYGIEFKTGMLFSQDSEFHTHLKVRKNNIWYYGGYRDYESISDKQGIDRNLQ